jgi:hypothetical protein
MVIGKKHIIYASVLVVVIALVGSAQASPDLVVKSITPNCGELFGNESNVIEAEIENIGNTTANASHANFVLSDGYTENVSVPPLDAGNSTIVAIIDSTIRTAGAAVNITVIADCDGAIAESNETNNASFHTAMVVNNGYKGKRYTGGNDLDMLQVHTLKGDIIYSTGDSYYLSSYSYPSWTHYTAHWNASDSPVPNSASVEEARLYVYYTWDTKGVIPDNISLTFNGYPETPEAVYSDRKGYGSYNYPSGMVAYNVTSNFNKSGNTAILTNSYPGGGSVSMQGMLLIVIYAESSEPKRTIWINEECDLLSAKSSYCTTPEEATAYAPFDGTIDLAKIERAKLITVAPSADKGGDMNRLYFNDHVWNGTWDHYIGNNTNLGLNETEVTADLNSSNNLAKLQDNGDSMEASNAILVVEYKQPDLIVTGITLNCGYLFANESNEISATIKNNGSTDAEAFTVFFVIDGFSATASVSALSAGNDTQVSIIDPTSRTAGDSLTITVTADCNGEVSESNETNNVTVQTATVMNNGYKGKRYTGGEDITTWQFHDQAPVNLIYSTGDSTYQGGYSTLWTTYTANWTAEDLPIPNGATIKKVVLYTYYTFDRTPAGNVTDYFTVSFNGHVVPLARHYTDRKGYGSYDYPYGMVSYDVASYFNDSGVNPVVLENTEPTSPHHVSLSGMMLMVVYEHADEPTRMIWINEGFDILSARDSYCVTSEEATAYVPFTGGSIETASTEQATLVTVMQDAFDGDDKNRLYFNGGEWPGIWDTAAKQGDTSIAINETDVLAYLDATGNEARLQSHIPDGETMGDGMGAANTFLVVEYKPSKSKRGGGGGTYTATDSDGDGYSDIEELLAGTDPNNADEYPHKSAVTPASTPTITPTPKPIMTPVPTPVATPGAPPASATPTPTPEEPGFEAIFTVACLVVIAYVALRKRS